MTPNPDLERTLARMRDERRRLTALIAPLTAAGVDRGLGGPILAPSSYFMKHPPEQVNDDEAHRATEAFIRGE